MFESIGLSDGISKKIVETALKNKIHVITPNKALIAKHGDYLSSLAEKNNVNLEFEAAVAGGIPILRSIKEGIATNKISKVFGIFFNIPLFFEIILLVLPCTNCLAWTILDPKD